MHLKEKKKKKGKNVGWVEWGFRWVGRPGGWGGFGWEKVNLLRGIFISSSSIALCLILVVLWTFL